jgi:prevent-host-death family protein
MAKIPATEFKAKCLELMDRVADRHETYVITKRGKPVAKLVPVERDPKENIFGWLRARGSITGDIVSPAISSGNWKSLSEWQELNATEESPNASRGSIRSKRQRRRR